MRRYRVVETTRVRSPLVDWGDKEYEEFQWFQPQLKGWFFWNDVGHGYYTLDGALRRISSDIKENAGAPIVHEVGDV